MFLDLKDYWKYLEDSRLAYVLMICTLYLHMEQLPQKSLDLISFRKINVLLETPDILVFDLALK